MKILLLGHRDIASNVALSLVASALPQHRFEVMLSGDVASQADLPQPLARLSACEQRMCDELQHEVGSAHHGLRGFRDLSGGREPGVLARPNSEAGLRALAECAPDLVVSVRYRRILGEAAIAVPPLGVLNLHSGLLPDYKGMMATFWAMLNGEGTIGSTAHYIVDRGIDTGPIVGHAPLPSNPERSYLANVLSLYPAGCAMLVDIIRRIERGNAIATAPQSAEGRYFSLPTRADIARFTAMGLRLCDGDEWP